MVKRDFKKKYKRSILGVLWSMLAPLFTLLVMNFVFGHFFGRGQEHYTIYLFSGWLIFQYYNEATKIGVKYINAVVKTPYKYCTSLKNTNNADKIKPTPKIKRNIQKTGYISVINFHVIDSPFHVYTLLYSLLFFAIGCWMYKKYNYKFLYYV